MCDSEEYQKCIDSPAYFYNNYCLIKDKDGNWVKPKPITDEDVENAIKACVKSRKKRICRSNYQQPLFWQEFIEKYKTQEIIIINDD